MCLNIDEMTYICKFLRIHNILIRYSCHNATPILYWSWALNIERRGPYRCQSINIGYWHRRLWARQNSFEVISHSINMVRGAKGWMLLFVRQSPAFPTPSKPLNCTQIHTKYPQDPYYDYSSSFQNHGNSFDRPPPGRGPLSYPNNASYYTTLWRSRQATRLPAAR